MFWKQTPLLPAHLSSLSFTNTHTQTHPLKPAKLLKKTPQETMGTLNPVQLVLVLCLLKGWGENTYKKQANLKKEHS